MFTIKKNKYVYNHLYSTIPCRAQEFFTLLCNVCPLPLKQMNHHISVVYTVVVSQVSLRAYWENDQQESQDVASSHRGCKVRSLTVTAPYISWSHMRTSMCYGHQNVFYCSYIESYENHHMLLLL